MQQYEPLDEGAGAATWVANGGQTLAQRGQHARDGIDHTAEVFTYLLGLHAPEQQRHQGQVAAGVALGPLGLFELRPGHYIGPGAGGKFHDVGWHLTNIGQCTDVGGNFFGQHLALFGAQQGLFFGCAAGLLLFFLCLPSR